jgi:hypothetical protein
MANWVADFLERETVGEIVKRHTHSIHTRNADGTVRADFTGAPCHYLDTDGLYKPLDTKLVAVGAEYGAPGLRARIASDGLVSVFGGTYSHLSTRIGIFKPTTKAFSSVKTIPTGQVLDDKMIAESGIWRR